MERKRNRGEKRSKLETHQRPRVLIPASLPPAHPLHPRWSSCPGHPLRPGRCKRRASWLSWRASNGPSEMSRTASNWKRGSHEQLCSLQFSLLSTKFGGSGFESWQAKPKLLEGMHLQLRQPSFVFIIKSYKAYLSLSISNLMVELFKNVQ